jgi:hypothetical protein
MKRLVLSFFCAGSLVFAQEPAPSPESSPDSGLRPRLYDLAGAIGNEGFKVRDGAWTGVLQGSKPQRLAVNLFAGNQYWFCATTSSSGETPSLSLRNPAGQEVESVDFEKDGMAAVGVTAPATGRYVLEVRGSARGSREFCVLYLFK